MSRISYRIHEKFDITTFSIVTILTIIGLMAIFSATRTSVGEAGNFPKQLISWGVSLVVFFTIVALPIRYLRVVSWPMYFFALVMLVVVLVIGKIAGGAKSWIHLGSFSFQPSEVAKIATILAMAHFLSKKQTDLSNIKDVLSALGIGLFPVFLIMLEPDLGSSFTFFGLLLAMLFWKGIDLFGIFFVLSPVMVAIAALFGWVYLTAALVIVLALLFVFRKDIFMSGALMGINIAAGFFVDNVYSILSPHQKKRIDTFVNPDADPLGAGYNSMQAKIAIGSGGFLGKGFLAGNQTQLHFIPEQWTDFIFCVIGEEFGFWGSILVIGLYIVLFVRLLNIASMVKDEFYSLVTVGILTIYIMHFIINIGMAIGVIPVIGIPLPFVSYGGSSLLANMAMLGIVLNIHRCMRDFA